METQRFVQQNPAAIQSPSIARRSVDAPVGKTRSVAPAGAEGTPFQVRVDPPQSRVRAPRSPAEQLTDFVAQFQAETARQNSGNIGAQLAAQAALAPVPQMVNQAPVATAAPIAKALPQSESLPAQDQQKVEEAIQAIDRARQQASHAAAMSGATSGDVYSTKKPYPTATQSGIVSTISEAIASEVSQAQPEATAFNQPSVGPAAAIRQPFFFKPAEVEREIRPEVVFEPAPASATNLGETAEAPPAMNTTNTTLSANGLAAESAFQTTWGAAQLNPQPMTNLAPREPMDTEIVELPESLLREIADQHRQFESESESESESEEQTNSVPVAGTVAESVETLTDGNVSSSISVDLAAWDVDAFRWSQVTEDILVHASPVMDQLTHYSLDILTGTENRIAVAGLRRGQGTSTIAASVARWAVANGKRVLLVDADLGNPQLSLSAGLSPNVSWLNLIREDLIPSEAIIRSKATGICIMPLAAVVTPQTWPGHIYDRLGGLLEQVRHGFDLILMDVGPIGQLSNELSSHALMLDALMIVDENPSSADFLNAKSQLLKSGVRKFIAAQNSVGTASI